MTPFAIMLLLVGGAAAIAYGWLDERPWHKALRLGAVAAMAGGVALLGVAHRSASLPSLALLVATGLWALNGARTLALISAGLTAAVALTSLDPTPITYAGVWRSVPQLALALCLPLTAYLALAPSLEQLTTGDRHSGVALLIAMGSLCLLLLPAELGTVQGGQPAVLNVAVMDGNVGQHVLRLLPIRFAPASLNWGRIIWAVAGLVAAATLLAPTAERTRTAALGLAAIAGLAVVGIIGYHALIARGALGHSFDALAYLKRAGFLAEGDTLTHAWASKGALLTDLRAAPQFPVVALCQFLLLGTALLWPARAAGAGVPASQDQTLLWVSATVAAVGLIGLGIDSVDQGFPIVNPRPGVIFFLVASLGVIGSWAAERFTGVLPQVTSGVLAVCTSLCALSAALL